MVRCLIQDSPSDQWEHGAGLYIARCGSEEATIEEDREEQQR